MPRSLLASCVACLILTAAAAGGECHVCGPAPTPYATTCWSPGSFNYGSWSGPYYYAQAQWRPSLPPPPCPTRHCAAGCLDAADGKVAQPPEQLPMPRLADEQ